MTYTVLYDDLQPGSDFMHRLEAAIYEQVATIQAEAANTQNHDKRLIWASNVQSNPSEMLRKMKLAVGLQILSVGGAPAELNLATDAQIKTAVIAKLNNFLGD
jgi:hypothetical protein